MFKGARRPDEVEVAQVRRYRVHVCDAERNQLLESVRRTDVAFVQALQSGRVFARPLPTPPSPRALIGGDDRAAEAGKEGRQGLVTDAETQPTASRAQHVAFEERLGDEEELPRLAVKVGRLVPAFAPF